mmetsp:Transcript_31796/g.51503  ORF Transcript_31796/g.51503 Transcript_31796/m.51503 type:complete len:292 (-) Transcript_31796:67-942(-)
MFHGNAGHRGHRLPWAMAIRKAFGVGVVLTDPRGYGGNEGMPDEEGLYRDAEACLQWTKEVVGGKIVLYGESIGSGVAVELARRMNERGSPVSGVILQAAFSSLVDVAMGTYPFLFPNYLLKDRYHNLDKIDKIGAPLLVVHGTRDEIVPFEHGRRLFQMAKSPKMMLTVPGGDHNAVVLKAGMEYFAQMETFLSKYIKSGLRLRVDPETITTGGIYGIRRERIPLSSSSSSADRTARDNKRGEVLASTLGVKTDHYGGSTGDCGSSNGDEAMAAAHGEGGAAASSCPYLS